jgi:monofunctional biosynthetic peptidoglycan transglycosylase
MLYRHVEDSLSGQPYQSITYRWVSKDDISPHARLAVIAGEDQKFYRHHGFDIESLGTAISQYQNGGRLRGASTISQQTAKNLFLTPAKTAIRKGLEIWFTVLLEQLWDKDRILEVYLNIAEFGDHLFGIEAASRRYFGIPAKHLSPAQSALLAATLPNPRHLKALEPSAYLLKRQQWILGQMRNLGNGR